jgi:AGZA family xanthine/uracil permease-like MFS transporter
VLSLQRVFHLEENQTTVRRELLAGLTTFMTMAYIVVVNPQILSQAGMPVDGVLFATCISSAIATLIMGLWANYPIALAPGMSLNAYFTYSIVLGRGVPWQTALGVVFFSGVLFLLLTLSNIREQVVNAIPDCLKNGTAAGIGLFIAFIGLRNAKIIVANPATFVSFGKISDPEVLLAAAGLVFIAILMARRFSSAILLGIVAITLAGIPLGLSHWPSHFFSLPHPSGTFLQLDLRAAAKIGLGGLIFVFFFVDLFDNVGTLVGVCEGGGFLRDGKLPRAMFCAPLVAAIPAYATAPALVLVGVLMSGAVARVRWDDFSEAFPAFLTVVATPLTFSIATGLSLGVLSFTFVKLGSGRHREVSPLIWVLTILFVLRYAFLGSE